MADAFERNASALDSPAAHAASVTPNDSTDLAASSRALYIGTSGDVKVTTVGGNDVTFANVPVGVLPIRVKRVHATGTSATGIIAIW